MARFNGAMNRPYPPHVPSPTWLVCLTGALGLAVAMGIGRFAFTPLLPLMQGEALIGRDGGAWLAAANYLGYLLGALSAAYLPGRPRAQVVLSLLATAALTASMAASSDERVWTVLRLAAGMVSAWTLVAVSGWAVSALAQRQRSDAAGWVFAGVGLGMACAGSWVWWRHEAGAQALWAQLGGLALGLAAAVALLWPEGAGPGTADQGGPAPTLCPPSPQMAHQRRVLVLCYGTLGFGYILPATYLPALAKGLMADPNQFGLVWPVFGLAAAGSTLLAGRALRRWPGRRIWAASHAAMALGCALPLLSHSGVAITLAALLVGGTFMVATMTGLQEARRLAPTAPRPLLARMTAAFALGQIAGPLLALALSQLPGHALGVSGMALAQALAVVLLLSSARWLYQPPTLIGDPT